ncbi:MAG TPA: IclR family transcriptional regulator [Chloroflexota bacterium]|jgi:DNA-binding IclR family transcriptional regulator|nr:IclR family transcriptional regulator [Chloroflexota bacterium]
MKGETIKVLDRALEIMRHLALDPRGRALGELSASLKLPKSTTRRFLLTLARHGFVEQDPETERYRLGLVVLGLSTAVQRHSSLAAAAQPVLERLRDDSGETAAVHVRFGDVRVCLAVAESRERVRYVHEVGQATPLYAGAQSKVLLAALAPDERAAFLARVPLRPLTERTLVEPMALAEELERVRRLGYAVSTGEVTRDAAAVAAPLHDRTGRTVASIGVTGPLSRLSAPRLTELVPLVVAAAADVSRRLGYPLALVQPASA